MATPIKVTATGIVVVADTTGGGVGIAVRNLMSARLVMPAGGTSPAQADIYIGTSTSGRLIGSLNDSAVNFGNQLSWGTDGLTFGGGQLFVNYTTGAGYTIELDIK